MTERTSRCSHPLDALFYPRSLAVVGVSKNTDSQGFTYLRQHLEFPFQGPVYPVGLEAEEVLGVRCYKRILDISGPVDHVISCIPQHQLPPLLEDCILKGVRSLHLFTARLAETQVEERINLENRIIHRAREAGVRIIGPNCLGLYNPGAGLTFRFSLPKERGSIGYISQSGGYASDLEYQGAGRGLRFSKIVSFGNAADLNESDFLEYMIEDPNTKVIAMYLEGVKQGRRFLDNLKRSDGTKPVILFKGGKSRAGSRAVATHTASMSGEAALWEALCRQFGVINVGSMQEMADVLLAFQYLRPSSGERVWIIGGGGGGSVAAADTFEMEGFEVPPLPDSMREKVKAFAPEVWSMISNPMDPSVMGDNGTMTRALEMGAEWDGVDMVVGDSSATWYLDSPEAAGQHEANLRVLLNIAGQVRKPMAIVTTAGDTTSPWRVEALHKAREKCREKGVPTYPNIQRAARALAHFAGYHRRIKALHVHQHRRQK
jgi:acyl-CoA synthetase (NDP forming)